MAFSVNRETLIKPLQQVVGAVNKAAAAEVILSHLLIEVREKKVFLLASDTQVELQSFFNLAEPVSKPLALTVSARKLLDICRNLPDDANIQFTLEENKFVVSWQKSRFSLATLPAEKFPRITKLPADIEFSLPEKTFAHLLNTTFFAMAEQDVRYFLNGLYLHNVGEKLMMIGADGHRMAVANTLLPQIAEQQFKMIIPRRTALELKRLLANENSIVQIAAGKGYFRLLSANFEITSKLIDSEFPPYDRILMNPENKVMTVDKELLRQVLTRIQILSNDKTKIIALELTENNLKISTQNAQKENAEETMPVKYTGEPFEMGFNVQYLLEPLMVLPHGDIKFYFQDAKNSTLIKSGDPAFQATFVIMPLIR